MTQIAPHIPAAHTAAYDRLMRLADQILTALETAPRPTTAIEIGRTARAIMAVERMLRGIYTPLLKAKPKPVKEATPAETPAASRRPRAEPPSPSRPEGLTGEETGRPVNGGAAAPEPTEEAKPEVTPAASPHGEWSKGWADKQAQMREQRAARIGKWPDGTPYKKSG
jgi:septal ring-binding cell division protein DamX